MTTEPLTAKQMAEVEELAWDVINTLDCDDAPDTLKGQVGAITPLLTDWLTSQTDAGRLEEAEDWCSSQSLEPRHCDAWQAKRLADLRQRVERKGE